MSKINFDRATLEAKRLRLAEIGAELKTEFFGIDRVIDAVIESIKTWYLLPEIVTRPIIICLFGLTGIGKTALVRSLVNKLGFSHKFVEVQMDGFSNGGFGQPKSICEIMESSSINEGEAGVLLLDEFQRYRTVSEKGEDVKVERYQDVWMLLSDGKFSNDYSFIAKLEQELAMSEYYADVEDIKKEEEAAKKQKEAKEKASTEPPASGDDKKEKEMTVVKRQRKYKLYPYEARMFKKLLKLPQPLTEIMTWETSKVHGIMREYVDKNKTGLIDYSKCLIFVAGNMDEAFKIATDVEDCDTSADVYYEYTSKIGIIEVKKALTSRFRPEQIARLGNNHIIYPSLCTDAYMSIIRRACRAYTDECAKICGISFDIEEKVYKEIYENSVYPTQGTRPVFTSIHKMFGSPLSDAILWALEQGVEQVTVGLDVEQSALIFSSNGKKLQCKIQFDIRARRASRSDDFNALVAVHEAGHALVYADLFHMPPVEVAVNVASFKGGFNLFKDTFYSKSELIDRIAVGMGGIIAEELIFGQEARSTGCSSDITQATVHASNYVRLYAMDGPSTAYHISDHRYNTDVDGTNIAIDNLVKTQRERVNTILTGYRDLLIELSKELLKNKKIGSTQFETWAAGRVKGMHVFNDKDVNIDYSQRLLKA